MSAKRGVMYFRPGQLLFHVRGSAGGQNQALLDWANGLLASRGVVLEPLGEPIDFNQEHGPGIKKQRLVSASQTSAPIFDREQRPPAYRLPPYRSPEVKAPPPFSLVFATAKSDRWPEFPPYPNPDPIRDQVPVFVPEDTDAHMNALKELLDVATFLDDNRAAAPAELEVVTLNWLLGGVGDSQPGGTGGPGGKPSPVMPAHIGRYKMRLPTSVMAPPSFANVAQAGGGKDVVVAILDTAHTEVERNAIYRKWVTDKLESEQHPLIKSLWNGCLTVHNDASVDTYMQGITIEGHDYDMTDHGLFVAGIIHSLAPEAELHLYEVLNQFGLGDLQTIGNALQRVINEHGQKQLVVNLSLTMNMPWTPGHLSDHDDYGIGQRILDHRPPLLMRLFCWIVCFVFETLLHLPCPSFCETWFDRQARPFEWICDLIYQLDSRVIAAAGNNGRGKLFRPMALYPAAFKRVFGVGALPRGVSPTTSRVRAASYSNLADWPPRKGITTLGGETGQGNGIMGVYTGEFPKDEKGFQPSNDTGWAWWCGTSFATPIVSGVTASVLSNLNGAATAARYRTEDAITQLYDVQYPTTAELEEVFVIEQG